MKNQNLTLIGFISILLIASIIVIVKMPIREGLDIKGGMRVVLQAEVNKLPAGKKWTADDLETVRGIIERRVNALGVSESVVKTEPDNNRIIVELPGLTNREEAMNAIQTTAQLEFRQVPELDDGEWTTRDAGNGYEQIIGKDGQPVSKAELDARIFRNPPILTGSQFQNAYPELTPSQGPIIHFSFKGDARRIFEEFTRANLHKRLAIFLDKQLISAPTINDVIPGEGIIEGHFTADQAKQIANNLQAGALPVPLEPVSDMTVEATLGRQAVHQTTIAGIIGLALVLLFMLWFYRLPGLLADLALIMYSLFVFALFKAIPVTLTVPGIAGFILSIGMAVDANVLIFERLKEERLAGRSMRAAIDAGFKRAFTAIFDSNACTLITCGILYWLGSGTVQGFALTLAIGVAVSMFTAITCSRTLLLVVAGTRFGEHDSYYALHRGLHPKLGVTRHMGFWFGLSGAVIIPGLIFWLGLHGTKYSIEFLSGTEITAQFPTKPTVSALTRLLDDLGYKDNQVLLAEGNRAYLTTRRMTIAQQDTVVNALERQGAHVLSTAMVSGAISKELLANALKSVALAAILIVLYLAIRFAIGGLQEGLKFGTCAIIATMHDTLVLWGIFAIMGFALGWQVDSLFVTAMLTVIGFSTHDTIVIFDRIRENLKYRQRGDSFGDVVDRSIEQTFARSINTSLTVVLTLTSLLVFGGPVVRIFVAALLIGVISGTYSSIFNASPLLVLWKVLTGDRPALAGATASAGGGGGTARIAPRPQPQPARPQPPQPVKAATAPPAVVEDGASGNGTRTPSSSSGRAKASRRKRRM